MKNRLRTKTRIGTIGLALSLAAGLALLAGCGGSSGSGGGAGSTPARTFGEIEELGSIVVNGVKFEVEGAEIIGADVHTGELAEGMVVEVEGEIHADGVTGTATQVTLEDNVRGPLTSVTGDAAVAVGQVMGQTVVFEDNLTKFGAATGVPAGDDIGKVFLVSGFQDDSGNLHATFVREDDFANFIAAGGELEVTGPVSSLGASTFSVNGLIVSFDATTPVRDLPGGLANGALVQVKGSTFDQATNTLTATDIEGKVRGLGDDMPKVHVEGLIAGLTATTFSLNGQPVNYANASFRAGEAADLANGIKVEAEGPLVNGVVVAVRVTFKASVRIEAAVEAVDAATGTVTFLGLPGISVMVRPELLTAGSDDLVGIAAGNDVKVRARKGASDLVATRFELVGATADRTIIRGPVTAISGDVVTILGTVDVNMATITNANFKDHDNVIGKAAFVGGLRTGDIVKARFRDGGWDEIEFQD